MRIQGETISGNGIVSDNANVGFVITNSSDSPLYPNDLFSVLPFTLEDAASADVTLTATNVANSCSVNQASQEQTVDLGKLAAEPFSTTGITSAAKRFLINLRGRRAGDVCKTANSSDSTRLALNSASSATNLGIAILNTDRHRIPFGQNSEAYMLSNNTNSASLVFYGQYVATGGTVTPVQPTAKPRFHSIISSIIAGNRCAGRVTTQRFRRGKAVQPSMRHGKRAFLL